MCVQSTMKLFTTSIFRTLSQKSFHEISYISYTSVPDILCLLTISGEGLGVGFAKRCRIILHLSSIYVVFLPHVLCSGSVQQGMAPCKMMKENARRMHGSARKNCKILHQSTILHLILHPILHPKSLVNTTGFIDGCRKCRRFSETFFVCGESCTVRKLQNIGLL